jgi:hypothetical protein
VRPLQALAIFWFASLTGSAIEFGGMITGSHPPGPLRETVDAGRLSWIRTAGKGLGIASVREQTVIYPAAASKRIPVAGGIPEIAYPADLWKVFEAARTNYVSRRPETTGWEIGNEPDFIFSRDLPDLTAAATKAAWFGLRAAGSKGMLLMPSMAFRPGPYAEQLVANDLAAYTDGWNFHFYGWAQDFAGNIREHRRLLSDSGLGLLPLWITEAGHPEMSGDGSRPGDVLLHRQAAHFERMTIEAWQLGVEGFAAFVLSPFNADGGDYGLVERDFSPRPALDRYLRLARELPASRPLYVLRERATGDGIGLVIRRTDGLWWTVL